MSVLTVFFLVQLRLWNSLPSECLLLTFDKNGFKSVCAEFGCAYFPHLPLLLFFALLKLLFLPDILYQGSINEANIRVYKVNKLPLYWSNKIKGSSRFINNLLHFIGKYKKSKY